MAKAYGIVTSAGSRINVEGMMEYRPIGSFSFLGRYRIIDFALSNLSNSDISRIQIYVSGKKPRSLVEHVGSGRHYRKAPSPYQREPVSLQVRWAEAA